MIVNVQYIFLRNKKKISTVNSEVEPTDTREFRRSTEMIALNNEP